MTDFDTYDVDGRPQQVRWWQLWLCYNKVWDTRGGDASMPASPAITGGHTGGKSVLASRTGRGRHTIILLKMS